MSSGSGPSFDTSSRKPELGVRCDSQLRRLHLENSWNSGLELVSR